MLLLYSVQSAEGLSSLPHRLSGSLNHSCASNRPCWLHVGHADQSLDIFLTYTCRLLNLELNLTVHGWENSLASFLKPGKQCCWHWISTLQTPTHFPNFSLKWEKHQQSLFVFKVTEQLNHRMVEVGGDHCRLFCPTPSSQAGPPRASCQGTCPGSFWLSPSTEIQQPPRATCARARSPSQWKSFSCGSTRRLK